MERGQVTSAGPQHCWITDVLQTLLSIPLWSLVVQRQTLWRHAAVVGPDLGEETLGCLLNDEICRQVFDPTFQVFFNVHSYNEVLQESIA